MYSPVVAEFFFCIYAFEHKKDLLRALFDKQTLPDNFKIGLTWESYSYQFSSNTFASFFLSSYIAKIGLYCICVALKRIGFTKQRKYWAIVHEIQEIALY